MKSFGDVVAEALASTVESPSFCALAGFYEQDRSRAEIIADALIQRTSCKAMKWAPSPGGVILLGTCDGFTVILIHNQTEQCGLRFFEKADLSIFSPDGFVFGHTDEGGDRGPFPRRRPVMDLWDVCTAGKIRTVGPSHVCGLQGFGASGDRCPACEAERSKRLGHE